MKRLVYTLLFLLSATAFCQTTGAAKAQQTRFFKAEYGTAADYLQLRMDGTYRVLAREHAGVMQTERGNWQQNGSVIKFTPSSLLRGGKTVGVQRKPYEGTEEHYKGKTFIAFKIEDSAGIVIPSEDTRRELDHNINSLPLYVFFKTSHLLPRRVPQGSGSPAMHLPRQR
jgi:hypothetical protein